MKTIFNKYNIPETIRGMIFTYIKLEEEFNKVLFQLEMGHHRKQTFTSNLNWVNGYKLKKITHAQDKWTITSWDPTNMNRPLPLVKTIYLSEKYPYDVNGWPNHTSRSDPDIKCHQCGYRKRYNKLKYGRSEKKHSYTKCTCIYNSVQWLSSKPIYD